jgi:ribose transport system substrate-binding protein
MNTNRSGLLSCLLSLVLLMVGACDRQPSQSGGKDKITIGFANSSMSHPWRVAINDSILAEAAKYPDLRVITTQADENAEKQLTNVENMLTQGIRLLLICTVSGEGSRPIVDAVKRANVALVPVDRNIVTNDYTAFVGQSNLQFGRDMADYIADELKKKYGEPRGNVVELCGNPNDVPSQDRAKGFGQRVSEKYPKIQIVATQSTDYSRTSSTGAMESILQAQPKIDAVYTHEDEIALGAIIAIKEAKRLGEVIVTGCGGSGAALESIKAGEMTACGTYSPIDAGTIGMRVAAKIVHGEPVPREVPLSGAIITKANVAKYERPGMKTTDYVYTVDLQSRDLPASALPAK